MSLKTNNGAAGQEQNIVYLLSARNAHTDDCDAARRTSWPFRNGSALETLIFIVATFSFKVTSFSSNVASGLKVCLVSQQNSEARKRPKKAVVNAAHSISLSFSLRCDFRKFDFKIFIMFSVTGRRLGFEDIPLTRLIPRSSICRFCIGSKFE